MKTIHEQRLYSILKSPHLSEKAQSLAENKKQFVFKVVTEATKLEIKLAIEKLFEVKVDSVNVINKMGKVRNFKQRVGKRSSYKKAYVTLKEGDINFIGEK